MLDLDILLFDDRVMRLPRLEIPHPRMHKRAFVLQPICDIDATIVHPLLGKTMGELLAALHDDEQRVIPLDDPPTWNQGKPP
jgi:2-amino-4-hydroxy-6-hydroxymethyldihydropteridine diphosphokinase